MSELEGNPVDTVDQVMDQPDTGSSEGFFEALEKDVNGVIADDTEATQQSIGPAQVTQSLDVGSNNVETQEGSGNWEKRYKDSSREAVKWRDAYKEVEAFVPILDTMKKDSGLVEHVREYLVNGGTPSKTIQEQIGLDEDFIFDQQEAMTDPNSDSAKLMNAQVDKVVQARVGQILHAEKQNAQKINAEKSRQQIESDFQEKKGMSNEQFNEFKERAKNHILTLEDVDYLLNRDQANANVVQHTKTDMLNQMKNVRNIPTTASGANSRAQDIDPNNAVFDTILGTDGDLDNLFG
jgi:transcriptional regulator with PAS, ATPase and Fis domain